MPNTIILVQVILYCYKTVSYTHLDVYKRQVLILNKEIANYPTMDFPTLTCDRAVVIRGGR